MFNIKHNPQSGRSMIEMSGILVLIGILSIGAVMGFNYAMDKYRASVTVNDIRLRGIDLLTRINRNQEVTLSEWDSVSSAGYLFQAPLLNDQGIALLTLTGVPPKVCDQVAQDISAEIQTAVNGVKYTGTDICLRSVNDLTFYFGTDSQNTGCFGNVCITQNTPPVNPAHICADIPCKECWTCDLVQKRCAKAADGTACTNGTCYEGRCITAPCASNSDCSEPDEYCVNKDILYMGCEYYPNPLGCERLDFTMQTITLNGVRETWYLSNYQMSWLDARSACEKMGKQMVSADMFLSEPLTPGVNAFGQHTPNERAQKLSQALNGLSHYFWTTSPYGGGCGTYAVNFNGVIANFTHHSYNGYLALCR